MKSRMILLIILLAGSFPAATQPIFSEDFASGIPPGWTNVDNSGNNILWRVTTTGSFNNATMVDEQLSTAGTSAANGYLIFDSDSAGSLPFPADAILTTPSINCSGHASVHLIVNEYFAQYNNSTGDIEVSNDNVNWTLVHEADSGLAQDEGTANPNSLDLDISSVAANQPAVYVRFRYKGNYDYWWFLDDLVLIEPPAIDLTALSSEKLSSEYTMIPLSQPAAFTLMADVKNTGLNAATGGSVLFEIVDSANTNTVFSEVINLPSINPGAVQTISPSGTFIPLLPGKFKTRIAVSIAGDGNPANDSTESELLQITDSVYARDDGVIAGVLPIGAGAGEDGQVGQNFRIYNTTTLTSVSVFLKDTLTQYYTGTPFFVTLHPQLVDTLNPDGTTLLATSETLLINAATIPTGGSFFTLPFSGGVQLTPGLYFLSMHEIDSLIPFTYSASIFSNYTVWVHWNSIPSPPAINGWARTETLFIYPVFMLRANFGQVPDAVQYVSDANAGIVFPNPSSGIIYLQPAYPERACEIIITDPPGRLIAKQNISGLTAVDLSRFSNGIYVVTMKQDEKLVREKVLITR